MHILTGGAGFIGSCFLSKLNAQGVTDVLVVDNLESANKKPNIEGKSFTDYEHKTAFLKRVEEDNLPTNVESIIHLGACSSTTEQNAEYMMENNYRYSRVLAEWAIKNNVRMIYASSAATYGDGSLGFSDSDELTPKLVPLNVYGYSKQQFDLWAIQSGASKKLAGLRFFNVYGPNEYHKGDMQSVVVKAFRQIRKTGGVKLFRSYNPQYADGEQKRDFIYVKDCSEVMWKLLNDKSINGIFNLGTGHARSWKDLVNAVFAALTKPPEIEFIEMDPALRDRYQYFTQAEMTKLPAETRSLEAGVADYVKTHLLNRNPYL